MLQDSEHCKTSEISKALEKTKYESMYINLICHGDIHFFKIMNKENIFMRLLTISHDKN